MYEITKITDRKGNDKLDAESLARKGCKGKLYYLSIEKPMLFEYQLDNKGEIKSGYLRSSIVEGYSTYDKTVKVTTLNSIYYLTED